MKPRHLLFLLLAVGAMAAAGDQAGSPSRGTAPPAQEDPAPPKPTPAPTASPTPDPEKQLKEFVPSEEIPADRAVAFPVDI